MNEELEDEFIEEELDTVTYRLETPHQTPRASLDLNVNASHAVAPKEQPIVDAYAHLDYKRHLSRVTRKSHHVCGKTTGGACHHAGKEGCHSSRGDLLTSITHEVADLLDEVEGEIETGITQEKLREALVEIERHEAVLLEMPSVDSQDDQTPRIDSMYDVVMPE